MSIDNKIFELRKDALSTFRPPAKLALSEWIESHVFLPSSLAAQPGRMRLWKPQIEIGNSIGDDTVERVTILKSARVGATQLMVGALGHFVQNDPSPVLCVVPAEADARHLVVSVIEPTFGESPALRAALTTDAGGRDTMLNRNFAGGSLTVVSARAPRNLRARTARILFADEIDAYELSAGAEGDPVELAMRRTMTFGNRKIVLASTPVDAETSRILRAYEQSDKRVFEVPCPGCGDYSEIVWADIRWDDGKPDTAHWVCPECGSVVEDRQKPLMVAEGRWRATAPHVEGHRGYKLTSLTSTLPNASWPRLAAEFIQAKRSPTTLKPWLNTVLGEPWRGEGDDLDDAELASMREPIGLDRLPPEALYLTGGADVQKDRIELTTLGWTAEDVALVLAHEIVWGDPNLTDTWAELDDLLRRDFRHPAGGVLQYDAVLVDSGDGGMTDQVYGFTRSRIGRRIFPLKGVAGFKRPLVERSKTRAVPLQLVGVDVAKHRLLNGLQARTGWRFGDTLSDDWFMQLTSERRVVRYSRGQPAARFERIVGRRAEALDCVVYAMAARALVGVAVDRREADLASVTGARKRVTVARSKWIDGE
ncbi:phage terminase large subunit family protein [Roseovarius sp. C7]|uniref:phage terminase large subunit family protein n=1 Tax=Roseovarius sp. C7 TaxID=3398643 RepID=UPI0039F6A343